MSHRMPIAPDDLAELRAMSRRLGNDLTLVQGSGGNTSFKHDDVLWVKASGTWLIDAEEQNILVPVDLPAVRRILKSDGADFNSATLGGTLRPSIETSLHCQLSHRIVAHVHSVNAIAWSVVAGAKERLFERLSGIDWRYIPYAKPGASLTAEVSRVLAEEPGEPTLLVLENHGLVLGGDTCAAVEALLKIVESKLDIQPRAVGAANISQLSAAITKHAEWRIPKTLDIHRIAFDKRAVEIATGGVLIPDHAVFLGKKVPVAKSLHDIDASFEEYRSVYGDNPDWMIVRDSGVILSNNVGAVAEDQLRGLAMISLRIPAGASIRYIDEGAARDLRSWDAEKYRKDLSRSTD